MSSRIGFIIVTATMGIGANVLSKTCKRKEERKIKKKLKKMQKVAHASRKKIEDVVLTNLSHKVVAGNETGGKRESLGRTSNAEPKDKQQKKKKRRKHIGSAAKAEKRRKEELKRSIEEDEAQIKRYETLLGYKKRKSKNMPQVFRAEGLDYILEICDPAKRLKQVAEEGEQSDSEAEQAAENPMDAGDIDLSEHSDFEAGDKTQQTKRVLFADTLQVYSPKSEDSLSGDESGSENKAEQGMEMEDKLSDEANNEDENSEVREDIYGRLVDRKTGEVISKATDAKQRLIKLEEKSGGAKGEERLKLEKNLRGTINRLNENTIVSSVKSICEMFASHAHNDVKQTLFDALYKSVAVGYRLPERIVVEYALFIALIHSTVSTEISSHFVEAVILRFIDAVSSPPEDKSLENVSVLLAEIYNFKVIKASMVNEVLDRMRIVISDKLLECSKLILTYSGAVMKSRDSDILQKYLNDIQLQLSQLPKERLQEQHVRFLVEEFLQIKNANIRKWTDAVDRSLFDHYVSIFRGLTKKVEKEPELGMSVDDIVHVTEKGRWWLVGSAWQPSSSAETPAVSAPSHFDESSKFDASLLSLAKKARMNTTLRKTIFCSLVSSKDEMDAFEKLMRLSLKGQQEREIIHICVHCALRESFYNPFYAAVLTQFCAFHKRFKLTTQYALWDRIRELDNLEAWQRPLLAAVIADLILKRSVGITVLKVIEFGTIDRLTTRFLRRILTAVLTRTSETNVAEIFSSIISSPKHKLFSQGLQLFVQMALRKEDKRADIDQALLYSRINLLESLWENEHF
ncbi:Nucleolar MIF4G domain-containing protein 1 [Toxocara canis]|uniref:Nucleolar MIF4G domain-containing protein 1 n=1 Tax=Toxocara canis TaxID=6265 RepID=A0A0B2V5W5_TOXCA|nr:Nucleolar MIF4G domain-containing protein 1 [Toxocara canis]